MYPRGVFLLLCSSSFRHALLAPLLGFQGHQKRSLTYFKYTWSLALADFPDSFKKVLKYLPHAHFMYYQLYAFLVYFDH